MVGAPGHRLPGGPGARLLRGPALDGLRAGPRGGPLHPARPRLQPGLLEPGRARPAQARQPIRGGRPPAALLPLQRLRSRAPAPALQAPGPHPAERGAGAARAHPQLRPGAGARGARRVVGAALRLRGAARRHAARQRRAGGLPRCGEQRRPARRGHLHGAGLPRVPGLPERARAGGRRRRDHALPGPAARVAAGPPAGLSRPRRPRRQPADRLGAGLRERDRHGAAGAAAARARATRRTPGTWSRA